MGILNVTPDSFHDGGQYKDESSILNQVGTNSSVKENTANKSQLSITVFQNILSSIVKRFSKEILLKEIWSRNSIVIII